MTAAAVPSGEAPCALLGQLVSFCESILRTLDEKPPDVLEVDDRCRPMDASVSAPDIKNVVARGGPGCGTNQFLGHGLRLTLAAAA